MQFTYLIILPGNDVSLCRGRNELFFFGTGNSIKHKAKPIDPSWAIATKMAVAVTIFMQPFV